jgi:4'-phosphopantetheinyl transferase
MIELSDDVADLWIEPVPSLRFEEILQRIKGRLTAPELEGARRLISERHRILYAVSHAFTRSVLACYLGREETSIEMVHGEHGRPELRDRSLRFNLSHTEGIAVVAVTRSDDIGVDVERIDHLRRVAGLTHRVFTPAELQTWDGEPETFFSRWTLKEAYAKARGLGLSLGFHDFGFQLSEPPVLQCDPRLDDAGEWRFHSFEPLPGYRAAAAVRRRGPITWRRVAPEQAESLLPL